MSTALLSVNAPMTASTIAKPTGSGRPIDILVSNAGFSVRSSLLDPDLRQHDRGFEVMQRAVLVLGGAAARAMSLRGRGWIINVCSVSAGLTQSNYTAIKAWALNYSESLAVETAEQTREQVRDALAAMLD